MAKATMEQMKAEAIRRIGWWKLHPNVARDFKKGVLNMSETMGALFWLDDEDKKLVDDWARESGNLPYHVIRSFLEDMELLTILFVEPDIEEWEMNKEDSVYFTQFAYVINKTVPEFSEYGSVSIHPTFGGLIRRG